MAMMIPIMMMMRTTMTRILIARADVIIYIVIARQKDDLTVALLLYM